MSLSVEGSVQLDEFELDVSITVEAGEVVAVLGPNVAGKSTLLRAVAGLLPLDSGSVRLDGEVLDDEAAGIFAQPQDRGLGVVFQDHRLFPHLRVVDNVAFGLRARGVTKAAARLSARTWLDRLGLADLSRRYPRQLSGGQAQRVALGRALACERWARLLDEPLAALDVQTRAPLDVQTRAEVQGELREHLGAFAGPTVLVTHDAIEALLLAQRIVVVERGRVAQTGSPAEITSQPLTAYVARLVGMNLYAGTAVGDVVTLDGGGSLVAAEAPAGRVLAAVRPSAITVHMHAPTDTSARNVWPVKIIGLAPLGDRIRVSAQGDFVVTVDVTAAAVAELALVPRAAVCLSAKATDVSAYPG